MGSKRIAGRSNIEIQFRNGGYVPQKSHRLSRRGRTVGTTEGFTEAGSDARAAPPGEPADPRHSGPLHVRARGKRTPARRECANTSRERHDRELQSRRHVLDFLLEPHFRTLERARLGHAPSQVEEKDATLGLGAGGARPRTVGRLVTFAHRSTRHEQEQTARARKERHPQCFQGLRLRQQFPRGSKAPGSARRLHDAQTRSPTRCAGFLRQETPPLMDGDVSISTLEYT